MNFADQLVEQIKKKNSVVCVGLDPVFEKLPSQLQEMPEHDAFFEFNKQIIDATAEHAVIVKPQLAFYEALGSKGIEAFEKTVAYAKSKNLLVLADAKRNDIGSTAQAYAQAFFQTFEVDALTVNAYLGLDGIKPFLEHCIKDKGIFILVKTSNPSSVDFQDLKSENGKPFYERMAENVAKWGGVCIGESGYSSVGAVVGATFPEQAHHLRRILKNSFFLVPGFGAQGGTAQSVKPCFNEDGLGAIVNSSREVIYAFAKQKRDADFANAAGEAAEKMKDEINAVF